MTRRLVAALAVLTLFLPPMLAAQEPSPPAAAREAAAPAGPVVNLNTATAQQLESLPGIGARTAQRILEYRDKNGGFKKVEELMNVKGIGERSFLKLKPRLTVASAVPKA